MLNFLSVVHGAPVVPIQQIEPALGPRILIFLAVLFFAAVFTIIGVSNILTRTAHESGKRRRVNRALGASNEYTGGKAVLMGYINIACGVGLFIFGIAFLIEGNTVLDFMFK